MFSQAHTFAIEGLDTRHVVVEVDVRAGLPSTTFIGLSDIQARETRERVRSAIVNSGYRYPDGRVTVNLAPASVRRATPGVELPLALAILAATGQLDPKKLLDIAVDGDLGLSGDLRSLRGTIAIAEDCKRAGITRLLVPVDASFEAALVDGVQVVAVDDLVSAVTVLACGAPVSSRHPTAGVIAVGRPQLPDLADVRGHATALLGLEVAAAGGHHLLLEGKAGSGKTMLARRLPGLLPALTSREALDVRRVYSIAGLGEPPRLRPFRAPHHTISPAGLLGGGSPLSAGEVSLANHGVLFLDELDELQRSAAAALRGPLLDGHLTLIRGDRALTFPSRFTLVAGLSTPPDADRAARQRRRSLCLRSTFDLQLQLSAPTSAELAAGAVTDSDTVRGRVIFARRRQAARGQACLNRELSADVLAGRVTTSAAELLARACRTGATSHHTRLGVLRVAQTLADINAAANPDELGERLVAQALELAGVSR
jgi:magnesium chelatase family protein